MELVNGAYITPNVSIISSWRYDQKNMGNESEMILIIIVLQYHRKAMR